VCLLVTLTAGGRTYEVLSLLVICVGCVISSQDKAS